MCKAISFLLVLILVIPVYAGDYNACYKLAADTYHVPVKLLQAIATVESKNHPYAVNINGKSYYFDNMLSALKKIKQARNFDIGLMQINKMWFKKLGYSYFFGLNPCFNIVFGAYILRLKINKYGFTWKGIAAYHSLTLKRNKHYAWLVFNTVREKSSIPH